MAAISISGYLTGGAMFSYELKPTSVETSIKNIGEDVQAIDGTNRRFHRNYKREFTISFDKVRQAVVTQLETIFTTPDEFIFKDIQGNSYLVYTQKDSFSKSLHASNVSLQGVIVYDVKIGVCEV
jgi:hypothetical protein